MSVIVLSIGLQFYNGDFYSEGNGRALYMKKLCLKTLRSNPMVAIYVDHSELLAKFKRSFKLTDKITINKVNLCPK